MPSGKNSSFVPIKNWSSFVNFKLGNMIKVDGNDLALSVLSKMDSVKINKLCEKYKIALPLG